jgi:hypothetical protein
MTTRSRTALVCVVCLALIRGVIDDPCPHDVDWEQSQLPVAGSEDDAGQPLGYLDLYLLGSTLSSIVLPAIERKSP